MDSNSGNSQQVMKLKLNNNLLSEFTRRKNWSQSILGCLRDVVHVLNSDLYVIYCSSASSEFLGYKPSELVGHSFTEFIHVDDVDMFVREYKASKDTIQKLRICFRFLRKDGKYTTLETRGHFYKNSFFGNARRMPTETAHLMDSFLDLKMENEALKKKLQALKVNHNKRKHSESSSSSTSPVTHKSTPMSMKIEQEEEDESNDSYDDFYTATASNVYTQGVSANYNIAESLAMFTGLRYDLGERSVGISTGFEDAGLTTIDYNQAIAQPTIASSAESLSDKPRTGKKQRIEKTKETNICTDCGTIDAPEWRKGPHGPKTLCNACGLRWSKTQKKLEQAPQ